MCPSGSGRKSQGMGETSVYGFLLGALAVLSWLVHTEVVRSVWLLSWRSKGSQARMRAQPSEHIARPIGSYGNNLHPFGTAVPFGGQSTMIVQQLCSHY